MSLTEAGRDQGPSRRLLAAPRRRSAPAWAWASILAVALVAAPLASILVTALAPGGGAWMHLSRTVLPDLLVKARIVEGLTQRQLAERLGVAEEAVQRDEAGGYARAGLDRLARVAAALGVRLRLTGHLESGDAPTGAPTDRGAQGGDRASLNRSA